MSFARDDSGTMSVFSIFMFLALVTVSAIGIDLMYNELRRVKLQDTLDRAVLAAANLDQELPAAEVVADYFAKAGLEGDLLSTSVDEGDTYRTVSATALRRSEPILSHLLGVEELSAGASGTAEERVNKVEVSLVLDISGSMANNSKLANLKVAANQFIDTLITPENADRVSINLIPYSEHVNAGPELLRAVNTNSVHSFSHCVEFATAEYGSVPIDTTLAHEQAQHYQWNYYGYSNVQNPICPDEVYERITPFSQNATTLKAQINQLQPRAGTSIFLGMKWAAAMLDPSFNTVTTQLVSSGNVETVFSDRPVAYSDGETTKIVVLMTDGKNDFSNRV